MKFRRWSRVRFEREYFCVLLDEEREEEGRLAYVLRFAVDFAMV